MSTFYSEDHEYIKVDGEVGTVGISVYAQDALGDIVFVEVPDVGASFAKGDDAAVVESVKAASDVYAPVGGDVTETNGALEDAPETVNSDAEGEGWFFKMKIADASELESLMDASAYKAFCNGL